MSHITAVKLDPGENQPIIIRRQRDATLIFRFTNIEDISVYGNFSFTLYKNSRDKRNPILSMVNGVDGDLTLDGNEIQAPFTESNSDIDAREVYYELKNTTTKQNWFQGPATILTGEAPEDTENEVERTLNVGEIVFAVTLTVAGFDVASLTDAQLQALYLAMQTASSFDYELDFLIQ